VGRDDTPAARRAGLTAFGSVIVFMCFGALLFVLFPHLMAEAMSNDPRVIDTVAALFVVVAVFQISDGVQAVGAGALRGTGDTTFTFWANIVGHWGVGLPVAWLLGVYGPWGVVGLWWGLFAGLSVVAVVLFVRFVRSTRGRLVRVA
jgi:MATE family multidrug resistance protein